MIETKNYQFAEPTEVNHSGSTRGFTLVEMMVVIGVMVVILALVIVYNRAGDRVHRLPRVAEKMAFDIRRARDYALTLREFSPGVVPCAYGVSFDTRTTTDPAHNIPFNQRYIIFADLVGAGQDCRVADFTRNLNGSEDVEVIRIEGGIAIGSSNVHTVIFTPPSGGVSLSQFFFGIRIPLLVNGEVRLFAVGSDPLVTRAVMINNAGRIDVAP